MDHYGTSKLCHDGLEFNLLNDYGDQEIVYETKRIPDGYSCVFTPCIITQHFNVEVADFVFNPYHGLFLINHKTTSIPPQLRSLGIDIYRGKRAFYYDYFLSLRIVVSGSPTVLPTADASLDHDEFESDLRSREIVKQLPKIYRDIDADKWICSPRIKLYLRQCR